MRKSFFLLLVLTAALTLPSCYSTRTQVGHYRELVKVEDVDTYTYSKGKQAYLFWGFFPMGRTQVATPEHGNCQVKSRCGFLDALVSVLTGGIFSMQTIKVKAPKVMNDTYSEAIPANMEDVIESPNAAIEIVAER